MSDYNPYSENLKCKWCSSVIMNHTTDRQCDSCWGVLMQLPDALHIPSLLKEIKRLIEKHDDEARARENLNTRSGRTSSVSSNMEEIEKENKETQEILQNPELMKELEQSIEEMRNGNVISLEEAEKESFKEDEN